MDARSEDPLPDLMVRYQAGDHAAFEELYRLTVDSVESYLRRRADPRTSADLVQETYLRVHRARRTYRPDLPFRPWLFAIARHVALQVARTRRRRWSREVVVEPFPEPASPLPETDVLARRLLEEALARLPPAQREVVLLAQVEGMSSVEISKVIGVTPGAIKVRLHRANRRLKAWVSDAAAPGGVKETGVD